MLSETRIRQMALQWVCGGNEPRTPYEKNSVKTTRELIRLIEAVIIEVGQNVERKEKNGAGHRASIWTYEELRQAIEQAKREEGAVS